MAVLFYSANKPSQSRFCGAVSTGVGGEWNLKDKGSPVPNDEARSCVLIDVKRGVVINVYDDPYADTRDDYTEIRVLQEIKTGLVINSFEETYNDGIVAVTHHHKNGIDGKVSHIKVHAPASREQSKIEQAGAQA